MSAVVSESLSLIKDELLATLQEARQVLETYIDSDGEAADLNKCADALHAAKGALQIAEAHGAWLLAEEMEETCRLVAAGDQSAPTDQGIEALTRAIVQLPAYVETIMVSGRDIPLVLLPLLNDLRSARGQALLSESTLLLLDTGIAREEVAERVQPQPSGEDIQALAKQLRTRFQLGLLGWIKGGPGGNDLASMQQVAAKLEQAASSSDVHQLWWIVGGVIEALIDDGLATGVAIKRLMGQADREIKRLATDGEDVYQQDPPTELINNLLYYIARATTSGERVSQIRKEFNLANLIPGDDQVEQLRQALAAPSANLMRTVADAIRQDLTNAKDVLDIFTRTGMDNVSELEPQVDMLRKISDTLGVLGLAGLRDQVGAHSDELATIVRDGTVDENRLVGLAASLLSVEDALDAELISLVEPPKEDEPELEVELDSDYAQVTQAVMRECVVNIARIKDAISGVMGQTDDRADIEELEVLLSGINAGLAMLAKERALTIVDKAGAHIIGFARNGSGHLPLENLNRLADAIVSIEYYMETIQNGRKEPDYMLDNAERCLDAMDDAALIDVEPSINAEESTHDATIKIDVADIPEDMGGGTEVLEEPLPDGLDLPIDVGDATGIMEGFPTDSTGTAILETVTAEGTEILPEASQIAADATLQMPRMDPTADATAEMPGLADPIDVGIAGDDPGLVVLRTGDDAPDPELLEIFLEEAKECVETIQREFPVWADDNDAEEALTTVRRSYHMLKGSGRMVGAELIGEYAWSVENLLNRILNNTLEPVDKVVELLRQAVAMTPEMIEQLEIGIEPTPNVSVIIANAHGYADHGVDFSAAPLARNLPETEPAGDMLSAEELLPVEEPEDSAEPVETATAVPTMDPVLLDILRKESATHIATLRDYVATCEASAPPFAVTQDVYRAAHTLQGSLTMAEAVPAIPVAEAMNQMVQHADEHGARLGSEAINAIASAANCLEAIIAGLDQADATVSDTAELIALFNSIREDIPTQTMVPVPDEVEEEATLEVPHIEAPAASPVDDMPDLAEFDPEIAAIFAEEAAEILDGADGSLNRLSNDASDPAPLAELQRDLHTLKGGARMAGVAPMGDFSHELEEFISLCADGTRTMTPDAARFLQRSFDELHRMREEVAGGQVSAPAAEFYETLQAYVTGSQSAIGEQPGYGEDLTVDMPVPRDAFIPPQPEPPTAPPEEEREADDETVEMPVAPVEEPAEPEEPVAAEPEEEIAESVSPEDDQKGRMDDKLGELARDFRAPAEPDGQDIVEALGITPSPVIGGSESVSVEAEPEAPTEVPATTPDVPAEPAEAAPREAAAANRDFTRVDSGALEEMLNSAGEISIFHSRLNQQLGLIQFNLEELGGTVTRLREQLRAMDIETEAQILHRYKTESADNEEFDPLEMDRFSAIQQLSRALAESSNDVSSIKDLLQNLSRETESLLVQQARTVAELQDNLMRTRMVPFQQHVPRLSRLVRQTANDESKQVEFNVEGGSGELDRQVLEKMLPPFEHMLRNAVIHGIERPEVRREQGKNETGEISIRVRRDGSEVLIEVADDGAGLNVDEIRVQASQQGDLSDTQVISDEAAMRLILKAGVTTAKQLTQAAGRGVGMDVVVNEVAKLGGSLGINSRPGQGTTFTIRLPYTLAVAQALIVQLGQETYALPMPSIEGVIRVPREEFDAHLQKSTPMIDYGGTPYVFRHLGQYLGMSDLGMPQDTESVSLILVKTDEEAVALITDQTVDSREIVVKPVGPQLATVRGVSGATILGDGRIVIILDVAVLVRSTPMLDSGTPLLSDGASDRVPLAMVVDDSITMRRVSQRLLERHGMRVVTANDGVDALEKLEDEIPDIVLLDIEMPRMDGYEFAGKLRNNPETVKTPIIMITSRGGEKHRARAIELGVNDYLGKPYQEQEMLESVRTLLGDKAPANL